MVATVAAYGYDTVGNIMGKLVVQTNTLRLAGTPHRNLR